MKLYTTIVLLFFKSTFALAQSAADENYNIIDKQFRACDGKSSVDYLINEYNDYILLFPNSAQEDEALLSLSKLYRFNKNVPAQLFTLVKLGILHPNSPLRPVASQIADSLIIFNSALLLTNENEKALKERNNLPPESNYQLAYIKLLSFFHFAKIKTLDKPYIEELKRYRVLFNKNTNNMDAVNYWLACAYKREGKLNSAIISYQKVVHIYKDSKFVAPSLLDMSDILSEQNKLEKATDCLIELINQFPDAAETGDAQFKLAQIYHYHFKDLNEALTNYKMLAQAFPDNKNFNTALTNAAKISEELGNYKDALNSYMMIVENNKIREETLISLKNIVRIQLNILKNYGQAAQAYLLMAQMFPDDKDAPENLLNAARLYKEHVKDSKRVNEIVQIILKKYKDSKAASDAEKLLN